MSLYSTIFVVLLILLEYNYGQILQEKNIKKHLGTRTPYRFNYNKNDSTLTIPECKNEKIWMIIRHGTRLPSVKDIDGMNTTMRDIREEIISQYKLGKSGLRNEQFEMFLAWSGEIDASHEKFLTLEGQDEMILLAERMQKRFPNIIPEKYDNDTFLFRYTATQRAQQSAKFFTLGLFAKNDALNVMFAPALKTDPVLRFYKHCDKWQKQVKKNSSTYEEQLLFGNSKEMNYTLEKISKKLGFDKVLGLEDVSLMYKFCGFETSWYKHKESPWCSVFDVEDAEVLEYYYELKHYWMDGYGYELTYRQACLAVKHMFDRFDNEEGPKATFLFAHSGTILKILAHMQLYKPESHLRANIMQKARQWRLSEIDSFASNLAFVLYRCNNVPHILTLHQERIIKLPMCKEELCSLEELKKYFHDSIFNCDMSEICDVEEEDESIFL